jgi:histo-blood group ABO system transferase
MKICILTIATNKYLQFVERLYNNIEENFLNGHEIECLLFTDHDVESSDNVRIHQIPHEPWPIPTLKRYNYFISEKEYISQFDYCFYFDVDMAIVDKVGDEVLGELVATMHPYKLHETPDQFAYERRPESLAYVPNGTGEYYFAGGFNGGSTAKFLEMSEHIANNVNTDLENNIIAQWHDESHMNRYLINTSPTVILPPSYCYPEELVGNPNYPFTPKIVALSKNHSELRS